MNHNDRNCEKHKSFMLRFDSVNVPYQHVDGKTQYVTQFRCKLCGWMSGNVKPDTHQCCDTMDDVVATSIEKEASTDIATNINDDDSSLTQENTLIE